MVLTFELSLAGFAVSLLTIAVLITIYYKRSFKYWKSRNIPCPKASFPFGSIENPLTAKTFIAIQLKDFYLNLTSQGYKHGGIYGFTTPAYLPCDRNIIKNILQQDFQYFADRGLYFNEKNDPLTANLFFLSGKKWQNLRTKLMPAFTAAKVKTMFDIMLRCGYQMNEYLNDSCIKGQLEDVSKTFSCYTMNVIGLSVFGIECNSFKHPDGEFPKYVRTVFEHVSPIDMLKAGLIFAFPNVSRLLGLRLFPTKITDFFTTIVNDTIKFREANNCVRNDMMQILIDLEKQEQDYTGENSTAVELAAQAFVFFIAGFETSSLTMTFCLLELAANKDIQEKVRNEINKVLLQHDGNFCYDAIMDMKYLSQALDEALRKYPAGPILIRQCLKDYKIPGSEDVIEKGTNVYISIMGLHYDPNYYSNPDKFDPERFSTENKQTQLPFSYLPFGEGPRGCIGRRIGLMQMKIGMAVLLRHFRFSLNEKTKLPIQMEPHATSLAPASEVVLDIEKVIL